MMKTCDIKNRRIPYITRNITLYLYKILAVVPNGDCYRTEEFDIKEFLLRTDMYFSKWCKKQGYKFVEVIRVEETKVFCKLPVSKFFQVCQEYEEEVERGMKGQLSFDDMEDM